jgi:phenylalanyl-tRNA synthetase beta chain
MPSITLNKDRVLKLLDERTDDATLARNISYLGTDLEEINKKEIIVEIFPNRPDLLSDEGFARALKTFLGYEKGLREYEAKSSNYEVIIDESVSKVRPYTACLVAKKLKITEKVLENIINIQEKLHITYGRGRKKCAIGVYPLDRIKFPIHYKALSPEKIRFIPLAEEKEMNGHELLEKTKAGKEYGYLLQGKETYPVFTDANDNVMSVPPILNSKHTGTITTETENVFVECSGFDFDVVNKALSMIGAALSDMDGEIYSVTLRYKKEKKDRITPNFEPEEITITHEYIKKYLGEELNEKEIIRLIEKMGHGIKNKTKKDITIKIPSYRADIIHPIDIIEDITIAYGYDNIKEEEDKTTSTGKESYTEKIKEKIRDILIGDGLIETVNYSLTKHEDQKKIGEKDIIKIKNPNTTEYDSLRRNLTPIILKTFKNNKMREYPQKIFEIGKTFKKDKEKSHEENHLNIATISDNASYTWTKQRLELIKDLLELEIKLEPKNQQPYINGRSAEIKIKHKDKWTHLGTIGEINLETLRHYELEHAVAMTEINIDLISEILLDREE